MVGHFQARQQSPESSRIIATTVAVVLLGLIVIGVLHTVMPHIARLSGDGTLTSLEGQVGLGLPVIVFISVFSTVAERSILFVVLTLALIALALLAGRARPGMLRHVLYAGGAACLFAVLFSILPPPNLRNGAPDPRLAVLLALALLGGGGFAVLTYFAGRLLRTAPAAPAWSVSAMKAWLPAAVVTAAGASLAPEGGRLFVIAQTMWGDAAVERVSDVNLNDIALAPELGVLFATGHGTERLLAFDLDDMRAAPRESLAPAGRAQAFAYNEADQEIYVYLAREDRLAVFNAATLELKLTIDDLGVAFGDPWLAWDGDLRRVVIVSEADVENGSPVVVIDRDAQAVVHRRDMVAPGNIALHPARNWLYLTFFRHTRDLMAYDVAENRIVRRAEAPSMRMDRVTINLQAEEVYIAAPMQSSVFRFDDDTLAPRGRIPAMFGVRSMAIDAARGLLVCASLANGEVRVVDIKSGESIARYRVGPWLRSVSLDTERGRAYVSSHSGLSIVDYLRRVEATPDG